MVTVFYLWRPQQADLVRVGADADHGRHAGLGTIVGNCSIQTHGWWYIRTRCCSSASASAHSHFKRGWLSRPCSPGLKRAVCLKRRCRQSNRARWPADGLADSWVPLALPVLWCQVVRGAALAKPVAHAKSAYALVRLGRRCPVARQRTRPCGPCTRLPSHGTWEHLRRSPAMRTARCPFRS